MMSYEGAVSWLWSQLEASEEIDALLARNQNKDQGLRAAIYDTNPADEPIFPYVTIKVDPNKSPTLWAQTSAVVTFDVYDNSRSSIKTNRLAELIEAALSFNRNLTENNLYLVYPNLDGQSIPDPDPDVSHISFTMQLKYWRNDLIEALN